ncbi:MAG: 2Fe-2S iron-sulfur cluster-binding protein, partial [Candidatus Limnocylindria bacterium]
MSAEAGRFAMDGQRLPYEPGDTVAVAVVRAGEHPLHGGTLCLAGDCGNCVAEVDGIAWVRTCLTPARADLEVRRHPPVGPPPWRPPEEHARHVAVRHEDVDVVVVGGGRSGRAAAGEAETEGRKTTRLNSGDGTEVVAIYAGPTVIARTPEGMLHIRAEEVVVATGAAEIQPVCDGNRLEGLVTSRAAQQLQRAGVDLGVAVAVGEAPDGVPCTPLPGELVRIEGEGRVTAVVTRNT